MEDHPTFPISTERLTLRPHRSEDAASLQAIYVQPDVSRFLLDDPWTAEYAAAQVEERLPKTGLDTEAKALALVIENNDTIIGDVLLWFTDTERKMAENGWVLDPSYGGRGFASEAVKKYLNWLLILMTAIALWHKWMDAMCPQPSSLSEST